MRSPLTALPFALLAACSGGGGNPAPGPVTVLDQVSMPARGYHLGVLPMPGDDGTIEAAYELAAALGDWTPEWGRPTEFWDFAADIAGNWGSTYLGGHCRGNGMFPIVQLSFMAGEGILSAPAGMANPTLSDPIWRELFKSSAVAVARAARPRYLSLGNEVNRWYESQGDADGDPNAFRYWVSLYEETYDAVKVASPDTQVFCVFAREVVSSNEEAELFSALELFDPAKLDAVMLTTYPYAVAGINSVAGMGDDYYSKEIPAGLFGKPFGFTEAGWTSLAFFGGEQGQVDFLKALAGRLTLDRGLDLDFLGWPWLHDLDGSDTIGLIAFDGTERLGFWKWKALSQDLSREDSIPPGAVKVTAATDNFLPVLHDASWEDPVPLDGPFNTAGVEDSPFITPDGEDFYFFFTPDAQAPAEVQLLDGASGVWWSRKIGGTWSVPVLIDLFEDPHLDGAHCVSGGTMWLGSIRAGNYGEADYYLATFANHQWVDPVNAGEQLNLTIDIGECHVLADGSAVYFGSAQGAGFGGSDLWRSNREGDQWAAPVNLGGVVNGPGGEHQPFQSSDGSELWFTRESEAGYTGPAIWRSVWSGGSWGVPAEIVSNFCGEPTLDDEGNLYFVHVFMTGSNPIEKIETDIYVAYRQVP